MFSLELLFSCLFSVLRDRARDNSILNIKNQNFINCITSKERVHLIHY
jgi:hypothetical protein